MDSPSPSVCNKGFVENQHCPIMLGKGFGTQAYRELFQIWSDINAENSFSKEETDGVNLLLARMSDCNQSSMHEEVLSGIIASTYQIIIPSFLKSGEENFWFEHQLSVPSKSASCADVAITNAGNRSHLKIPLIHGILVVKWNYSDTEFPEMQATAVARLFNEAGSLRLPWVPIFVLTKSHFSFGIAFRFFGSRWVYSEICEYRMRSPSIAVPEDVVMMCRFSRFMLSSAKYHQNHNTVGNQNLLVDTNGDILFKSLPRVIGDRVLRGTTADELDKVIKFYLDKASARKAVENKRQIEAALGLMVASCTIIEGCGDGFCAVSDKYIEAVPKISIEHVKTLTERVSVLHSKSLVHGDLRLQNIIFHEDAKVSLIDYEWAGTYSTARFPGNVNLAAFGKNSVSGVSPSGYIPADFDWRCLADIFECFENDQLIEAACNCNKTAVLEILESQKTNEKALLKLMSKGKVPPYVYFGSFSSRIKAYFMRQRESESREGETKKRKFSAAESAGPAGSKDTRSTSGS